MSARYQVRWVRRLGDPLRQVEYDHYALAESCFIALLPEVERNSGGWAEFKEGERAVVRIGDDHLPEDAEAEDALPARGSSRT